MPFIICSMYAAIAHQMSNQSIQQLRSLAADFMRSHPDEFMPFMDEVASDEQYMKYCDDVQRTAAWGSQLEVRPDQLSPGDPSLHAHPVAQDEIKQAPRFMANDMQRAMRRSP